MRKIVSLLKSSLLFPILVPTLTGAGKLGKRSLSKGTDL